MVLIVTGAVVTTIVAPPVGATVITGAAGAGMGVAGAGVTGATTGGIVGGTVVGGLTNIVTGSATLPAMTAMAGMGPAGLVGIGMMGADDDGLSWDCWKPVLHDKSTAPSSGMPMKEVSKNNINQYNYAHCTHFMVLGFI